MALYHDWAWADLVHNRAAEMAAMPQSTGQMLISLDPDLVDLQEYAHMKAEEKAKLEGKAAH